MTCFSLFDDMMVILRERDNESEGLGREGRGRVRRESWRREEDGERESGRHGGRGS